MEPAVTGLDWPFTTNPRLEECFARQHPCGPPSLVRATSPYPGLDRPASGFRAVTPGPIKTPSLTAQRLLRTCRFPYDYKATHFLASPQPLNSLARVSRRTTRHCSTTHTYSHVTMVSYRGSHIPSMPCRAVTAWFQALFTPLSGVLFSFPSRY